LRVSSSLIFLKDLIQTLTIRFNFTPTENETNEILEIFDNDLCIPDNFCQTAPSFNPDDGPKTAFPVINSQTREFCQKLGISDPLQEILDSAINNPLLAQDQRDGGHSLEYSMHSQLDISLNDTSLLEVSIKLAMPHLIIYLRL
jgi:hypothetical protein